MLEVRSLRSRPGAAFAALLWLVGTVALPTLHLARHTRPHDHEGGGIHYHLDADAGHDEHDDDDDGPGGPFTVEAPHGHHPSHHDDGLAHFAVATGDGAAAALAFTSEPDPEGAPDSLSDRYSPYFLEGNKAARAPPTA